MRDEEYYATRMSCGDRAHMTRLINSNFYQGINTFIHVYRNEMHRTDWTILSAAGFVASAYDQLSRNILLRDDPSAAWNNLLALTQDACLQYMVLNALHLKQVLR